MQSPPSEGSLSPGAGTAAKVAEPHRGPGTLPRACHFVLNNVLISC